jgi:hypothetical protein
MIRLRRWHKKLLISEAIATLVVLLAYHDVAAGQANHRFLAGLAGTMVLSPGLSLLGWPDAPSYPVVCIVSAAIYALLFFVIITLLERMATWLRLQRSVHRSRIDDSDLQRYLR